MIWNGKSFLFLQLSFVCFDFGLGSLLSRFFFFFFWQTFMNASGRGRGIGIVEKDSATKPPKTINRRTRWRLRAKRKRKSNDKKYTHGFLSRFELNFTWATLSRKSLVEKDSLRRTQSQSEWCLSAIEERFISSP